MFILIIYFLRGSNLIPPPIHLSLLYFQMQQIHDSLCWGHTKSWFCFNTRMHTKTHFHYIFYIRKHVFIIDFVHENTFLLLIVCVKMCFHFTFCTNFLYNNQNTFPLYYTQNSQQKCISVVVLEVRTKYKHTNMFLHTKSTMEMCFHTKGTFGI